MISHMVGAPFSPHNYDAYEVIFKIADTLFQELYRLRMVPVTRALAYVNGNRG